MCTHAQPSQVVKGWPWIRAYLLLCMSLLVFMGNLLLLPGHTAFARQAPAPHEQDWIRCLDFEAWRFTGGDGSNTMFGEFTLRNNCGATVAYGQIMMDVFIDFCNEAGGKRNIEVAMRGFGLAAGHTLTDGFTVTGICTRCTTCDGVTLPVEALPFVMHVTLFARARAMIHGNPEYVINRNPVTLVAALPNDKERLGGCGPSAEGYFAFDRELPSS